MAHTIVIKFYDSKNNLLNKKATMIGLKIINKINSIDKKKITAKLKKIKIHLISIIIFIFMW